MSHNNQRFIAPNPSQMMALVLAMLAGKLKVTVGVIAAAAGSSIRKVNYLRPKSLGNPNGKGFIEVEGRRCDLETYIRIRQIRKWRDVENKSLDEAGESLKEWLKLQIQPEESRKWREPEKYFKDEPLYIFTDDWRPLKVDEAVAFLKEEEWDALRVYTKSWIRLTETYVREEILQPFAKGFKATTGYIAQLVETEHTNLVRWASFQYITCHNDPIEMPVNPSVRNIDSWDRNYFSFEDLLIIMIFLIAREFYTLSEAGKIAKKQASALLQGMTADPNEREKSAIIIDKSPSSFRRVVDAFCNDNGIPTGNPQTLGELRALFPDNNDLGERVIQKLTNCSVIEKRTRGSESYYVLLIDHLRKVDTLESLYKW